MEFKNFSEFWETNRTRVRELFDDADTIYIHDIALAAWDSAVTGLASKQPGEQSKNFTPSELARRIKRTGKEILL